MGIGKQYAFIDETGDSGLSFELGASSHFILVAVIVDEHAVAQVERDVEEVRRKHFQNGEMKSAKVGKDDVRRIRILHDLKPIDFHVLVFVTDKRRLSRSGGFLYHDPFVKFLSKQLHKELYKAVPGIDVTADQHSDEHFMDELKDYVRRQLKPTLFEDYPLGFKDSRSSVLLQLADLIAGTVAKGYEVHRKSSRYVDLYRAIEGKLIGLRELTLDPTDYGCHLDDATAPDRSEYDRDIAHCAVRAAISFIRDQDTNPSDEMQIRVRFLEYLLFRLRYHNKTLYVSTPDIIDHLACGGTRLSKLDLRSKVVAPLRDRNVLIASSNKGYKIPVSEKELYEFVDHSRMQVEPMMGRLKKCRDQIMVATKNNVDVFARENYGLLRKMLDDADLANGATS